MSDVTCSSVWMVSHQYEPHAEERFLLNPVGMPKEVVLWKVRPQRMSQEAYRVEDGESPSRDAY